MAWKCPDCGVSNAEATLDCRCGFAYYKILGVKPGASKEEIKQAYEYLQNVWKVENYSHDPSLKKKAQERLKQINNAYKLSKHFAPRPLVSEKRTKFITFASLLGVVVLVIVISFWFSTKSEKDESQTQSIAIVEDRDTTKPLPKNHVDIHETSVDHNHQHFTDSHVQDSLQQPTQPMGYTFTGLSPKEAEDKAIELVKKSHVIDRFSDVETIMRKWKDENSDTLQIIGWKAKKMDEQTYLISYTASDGLNTRGFYFDINIQTGNVRHMADYPELQKKYGIQYNP